jgi:glutamine amidotransferase
MSKHVVVLDYGFGNIRSATRALARAGADVEVTADYDTAMNADGLLVPGVGAFAALSPAMQILFAHGVEHGVRTDGCDEWPGTVEPLKADVVPHMGWNTVTAPADSALFAGLAPDERYYFVHSYAVRQWELNVTSAAIRAPKVTWSTHGEPFVAAVENGPLWATQFHPEKSGDAGAHLLTNWLDTL